MHQVGSYHAKTHLPRLLKEVARGKKVSITRKGTAVALLIPVPSVQENPRMVIERLRSFRKGVFLKGFKIKKLIAEGRR